MGSRRTACRDRLHLSLGAGQLAEVRRGRLEGFQVNPVRVAQPSVIEARTLRSPADVEETVLFKLFPGERPCICGQPVSGASISHHVPGFFLSVAKVPPLRRKRWNPPS